MTQTAPAYTDMSKSDLIKIIESQKRTVNALQNEVHWYDALISNPAFNEVDIRLMVKTTPREIRMGYTRETPERKIFMPAIAKDVHASTKTVAKRIQVLKNAGVYAYRTDKDEETGNTRSHLKVLPTIGDPARIEVDRAKPGGSTWENGQRVKRCKNPECQSTNLVKVTEIICADCGTSQSEKTVKPVNDPNCHHDSWAPPAEEEQEQEAYPDETPNSQDDCWAPSTEEEEAPPPTDTTDTVYTVIGGSFEICEPPEFLRSKRIWTVGRVKSRGDGKYDKIPYIADKTNEAYRQNAKSDTPSTWRSWTETKALFDESQRWARPFDLLMYMCDETSTLIDKDSCYSKETGQFTDEALSLITRINSYTEFSWSEEAIHIITEGTVPHGHNKNGLEMYSWHRPVAWTGKHIVGTPTNILPREQEVMAVYREYFGDDTLWDSPLPSGGTCTLEDAEIIERCMQAYDGATFKKLWAGDASDYPKDKNGEPDHSRADAALYRRIGRVTGNDPEAIDRVFRQSGLYREKWERADYRARTHRCVFGSGEVQA